MATSHKKQHAVPASYLAAWTDPETPAGHTPYVYIHTKDGAMVRKKAPQKNLH